MIKRENAQSSNLASELESTRVDQRRLEEDIRNLQAEKESATCTYVEENNSIKKMEAQLRKLESTRQDLWREENEILQRSRIVTDDVERASKALRKVVSIVSCSFSYHPNSKFHLIDLSCWTFSLFLFINSQ